MEPGRNRPFKKANSVAQYEQLFYGLRRWRTVVEFYPSE